VFQPDLCHLPNATETPLDLHDSKSHYEQSYCKYAVGDYSLLFSFLSDYNWSYVYSDNTVDAAVDSFTNVILESMDLAISRSCIRKDRFSHWCSHTLIYYIWE